MKILNFLYRFLKRVRRKPSSEKNGLAKNGSPLKILPELICIAYALAALLAPPLL